MDVQLTKTRSPLQQLNNILKTRCGGALSISIYSGSELTPDKLSMTFDKTHHIDFIICLNYLRQCISSISCKINPEEHYVEFSSKTQSMYESRKYNVLLRSVLILLCPYITYNNREPINRIISRAINPASIYLMAKYFYAYNDKLNEYMNENGLTNNTLTPSVVEDFYYNNDSSDMDIDDEEKLAAYFENNENIGNPVLLTLELTNEYISRANEIFNTTITKLICPEDRIGGSRKKNRRRSRRTTSKSKRRRTTFKSKKRRPIN
jgi:hypothetical protein